MSIGPYPKPHLKLIYENEKGTAHCKHVRRFYGLPAKSASLKVDFVIPNYFWK